uniref:ATP-binding Cassette (ABC) superfamily n=1 Tax=Peronospora matthiolae TaxID=2874970 RepID=A0AAV1UFD7_9STRA
MASKRRPSVDLVEAQALEAAAGLHAIGAKLVCIDFDATFVTVHTGGQWTSSAEELRTHVRQFFLLLVPLLCEAHVHVAIVTFSPQVALIQDVLRLSFPTSVVNQLVIRGDDRSWSIGPHETTTFLPLWHTEDGRNLDRKFKLPFMISAALECQERFGDVICNRDTVLVDDDVVNIRVANDSGVVGVLFDVEMHDVESFCKRIRKLLAPEVEPTPLTTPRKKKSPSVAMLVAKSEHKLMLSTGATRGARRRLAVASGSGKRPTALVFNMCTPSPVTKVKCSVDMGRPRSKRASRSLRNYSREMDTALPVVDEVSTFSIAHPVPRTPVTVPASLRETLEIEGLLTSPFIDKV